MEDLNGLISWAFQGLVAGGIIYAAGSLTKMRESVESLNKSIATIIEKMEWHQKEIENHDSRITSLETSKRSIRKQGS